MNELKELFETLFASGTDNLVAGVAFKLTGFVLVIYYLVAFIKSNQSTPVTGNTSSGGGSSSTSVASKPKARRVMSQPSVKSSYDKATDVDKEVIKALRGTGFTDSSIANQTTSTGYKAYEVYERLVTIMKHAEDIQEAIKANDFKDVVVSGIDVKVSGGRAFINMGSAPRLEVPVSNVNQLSSPLGFRGIVNNNHILSVNAFEI